MNRDTRDTRNVTYSPPSKLDFPESVRARFRANGFELRWIRFKIRGEDDIDNMGERDDEGYTLVKPEEVPEIARTTRRIDHSQFGTLVAKKDLVLMKIPIERARARHNYYQNQARGMTRAMKEELMKHNDTRMPIKHDVDEKTGIGRSVKFADEKGE